MTYSAITIVVVGLYLVTVFCVGWSGRRLAANSDMFNIFGRRARTIRAMAGYLSLVGAGELIIITQYGYENGWYVCWFLAGLTCGYLFLSSASERMRLLARERGINTLAGYFSDQFGPSAGGAITIVFLVSLGSLLTIQFIVGSDLIQTITGVPAIVISIVMGAIIISYLIAAGFVAVLSTDVLRTVMMTAVLVVLVGFISLQVPGSRADLYSPLPFSNAAVLFVLAFFGAISAADIWQTIFASADKGVVRRSAIAAGLAFFLIGALIAQIGMAAKVLVPNLPNEMPVLVTAFKEVFPGALAPLVALLITGSVMATADTEIWVISTTLVSNIHPSNARRNDGGSDSGVVTNFHDELRTWTRVAIPLVTISAIGLAYVFHDALALFEGLLILLTAIGPVVLAVMFFSPTKLAVTLALWSGLAAFVVLEIVYVLAIPTNHMALVPMFVSLGVLVTVLLLPQFLRVRVT
jgi:SSS family solute:Na+ symporter